MKKGLVELAQSRVCGWERHTSTVWQRIRDSKRVARSEHSGGQIDEGELARAQMHPLVKELEGEQSGDEEHRAVGDEGGGAAVTPEARNQAGHKAGEEREMEDGRSRELAEGRENGLDTTIDSAKNSRT